MQSHQTKCYFIRVDLALRMTNIMSLMAHPRHLISMPNCSLIPWLFHFMHGVECFDLFESTWIWDKYIELNGCFYFRHYIAPIKIIFIELLITIGSDLLFIMIYFNALDSKRSKSEETVSLTPQPARHRVYCYLPCG